MMRRAAVGRPRRGLVGTMATTAVIAGTATAVSGRVNRRQQGRAQAQADDAYANQAALDSQAQLADMQNQMNAMQAQQAYAAAPPAAPAAAAGGNDLMSQLTQLTQMMNAGVLTPEQFEAAKAKLLGV